MTFNCLTPSIVFQEVPGEISLCFSITGCKMACSGCHSTELWNEKNGQLLSNNTFIHSLEKYRDLISCVVFFGGEWQPEHLIDKLKIAQSQGLKTCLYSGMNFIDIKISQHLTYLKTGKWDPKRGGLDSSDTNQAFFDVSSGRKLNHLFSKSPDSKRLPQSTLSENALADGVLLEKALIKNTLISNNLINHASLNNFSPKNFLLKNSLLKSSSLINKGNTHVTA